MIPEDLYYTKDHEWVRFEQGDDATIGITEHAQEALGDITFIDLPTIGRKFQAGEACAVIESVKAASDVYAPVTGEVTAVNNALVKEPETVNQDPYGNGWIYQLSGCDRASAAALMTAEQYRKFLETA